MDKTSFTGPGVRSRARRASIAAACVACVMGAGGVTTAWAGTFLPERGGSPNADRIASLYTVVLVVAAVVFLGVVVALVYALHRYGERRSPVAAQVRGNHRLEIGWTVAAAGLIVVLAVLSLTRLDAIDHPGPRDRQPCGGQRGHRAGGPGRGVAHRGGGSPVRLDVPLSRRRLLIRGDGRARRRDREARHHLARRRALVVDPEAGRQVRRDPGLRQPDLVPARATRRVPRPVRRAVRSQPRRHARPGPRRLPGRLRRWLERQKRSIQAAERGGRSITHRPLDADSAPMSAEPRDNGTAPDAPARPQIIATASSRAPGWWLGQHHRSQAASGSCT